MSESEKNNLPEISSGESEKHYEVSLSESERQQIIELLSMGKRDLDELKREYHDRIVPDDEIEDRNEVYEDSKIVDELLYRFSHLRSF